ncbi:hypothetical protein OJAV_G00211050 [Oryzias javanicus]|uniref:Uncharacterized protein n=1 Tax=Oryzias javanicus TaxID=123683 RepID=A0A437C2R4_ORYJA|nr:hypothetical protein OJAV_G00211050 [Oryzias javanicus]
MIRIFPDFSVQVTASAAGAAGGGGGAGGGMVAGPPVGRVPVPGATNGTPQSLQGISAYQQREYWEVPVSHYEALAHTRTDSMRRNHGAAELRSSLQFCSGSGGTPPARVASPITSAAGGSVERGRNAGPTH